MIYVVWVKLKDKKIFPLKLKSDRPPEDARRTLIGIIAKRGGRVISIDVEDDSENYNPCQP